MRKKECRIGGLQGESTDAEAEEQHPPSPW